MKKYLPLIVASSLLIHSSSFAQEEEIPTNPTPSSGLQVVEPPQAPAAPIKNKTISKNRPAKVKDATKTSDSEDFNSFSAQAPKSSLTSSIPHTSVTTQSHLSKVNFDGYVELDESIKNEPYEGSIDFPDATLLDIMKAISKLADKNYIIEQDALKGKRLTIVSPQKVTKEEAYNVFLTALYMNGFAIVSSGKFLRLIPVREASKSNVRVFYGDFVPASDEVVTLVYPLKNINPDDMQRYLQEILGKGATLVVYPETNSIVLTDSGLNLRRIISVLKSIDTPGTQPKLESIPINYASSKDISKLIEEILDAQAGGSSRRSSGSSSLQKVRKIQGGGVITKIVPDDRTNSLVVLANGKGIEQLRSLVLKLDSPNVTNSGNVHLYYVKNALAKDLAATLNGLLSSSSSASSSISARPGVISPSPTTGINTYLPNSSGSSNTLTKEGLALEGQIRVVADEPTNSLVIRATSSNFESLKQIIEKLDIPRRQVNVEATIMEIRVRDSDKLNIGANVAAKGIGKLVGFIPSTMQQSEFEAIISSPTAINGLVSGLAGGETYSILGPGGNRIEIKQFMGLIQAIQDLSLGQIMQQPNILTSDNEEGSVKIVEKIKVEGESTVTKDSANQTIVTRKAEGIDVTLLLKIKPQIGEDNELVKLDVEQEMTDYNSSVNVPKQIDTITRNAKTKVVVRDGDTVVIGGLEKNDFKSTRSKVPLLGDLPIIGNLFKGSNVEKTRSNLMLFLTPKIVRNNNSLLEITKLKLESRQKTGRIAYDPKDFHRKNVSLMLRDTKERLAGKSGWGFRKNTSANTQNSPTQPSNEETVEDDIPQDMSLPEAAPSAKESVKADKKNTSSTVIESSDSDNLLPAPKELNLENNSGFDDLDVR
jgi:general secretion pathway protein D